MRFVRHQSAQAVAWLGAVLYPLASHMSTERIGDYLVMWRATRRVTGKRRLRALQTASPFRRDELSRAWASEALAASNTTVRIEGLDTIDRTKQYVVTPLHEGLADVVALQILGLPLTFVARRELATTPPFGGWIQATEQILIDPERPSSLRAVLRQASSTVAKGRSLVIFPQGSLLGLEIAFRHGAVTAAQRLGIPILPVVIAGTHRIWEHPFSPIVRPGQSVYIKICPPVWDATPTVWRQLERTMKREALSNGFAQPRHFEPDIDGWWDEYRYQIDDDFPQLGQRRVEHLSRGLKMQSVKSARRHQRPNWRRRTRSR